MPPKGFIAFCIDFIDLCVGWIYQLKSSKNKEFYRIWKSLNFGVSYENSWQFVQFCLG